MTAPTPRIEVPDIADCEAVLDRWVALAEEQRDRGSSIAAAPNREAMHATLLEKIATGDLFVARAGEDGAGTESVTAATGPDRTGSADGTGVIRGFVTMERVRGRYVETAERGRVGNLYVDPAHRGRGIGTRLLDAAEARLVDAGAEVIGLEALAENQAAREFYRERGYAPHRVEYRRRIETDRSAPGADS